MRRSPAWMRTGRHLLAASSAACALAVGAAARAGDPPELSLHWVAPAGCPDDAHVRLEIQRFLGSSPASIPDSAVAATVTVRRVGRTWRAEVRADSEGTKTSRAFHGDSCEAVASAAALLVALTVNHEKVEATRASVEPPAPAPPPKPATAVRPPPPPEQPASPSMPASPVHPTAEVAALADIGTLPRVGLAASASAGLVFFGRFRVELAGAYQPDHDVALGDRPGIGGRFRKMSAGPRACLAIVTGSLEPSVCLGADYAYLHGESYGIRTPAESTTHWWEILSGATLRWEAARPLGLRLDGAAGFPLERRSIVIVPYGAVHRVPFVTARIGLGLDLRF